MKSSGAIRLRWSNTLGEGVVRLGYFFAAAFFASAKATRSSFFSASFTLPFSFSAARLAFSANTWARSRSSRGEWFLLPGLRPTAPFLVAIYPFFLMNCKRWTNNSPSVANYNRGRYGSFTFSARLLSMRPSGLSPVSAEGRGHSPSPTNDWPDGELRAIPCEPLVNSSGQSPFPGHMSTQPTAAPATASSSFFVMVTSRANFGSRTSCRGGTGRRTAVNRRYLWL